MEKYDHLDEYSICKIPLEERVNICRDIMKNSDDQSLRTDVIFSMEHTVKEISKENILIHDISNILKWSLEHDENEVVRHEICYSIVACDFKNMDSILVNTALYDNSSLVRHEAIEALGLLQSTKCLDVFHQCMKDKSSIVQKTAELWLQKIKRLKKYESKK